ncbi:MAG: glycoside hydrolase family 95 protein [Candidatus Omnitrophica bacterium]|nr:glycoside hydrolase family 95 protein [Candidatus Omnitrophota bacterium]
MASFTSALLSAALVFGTSSNLAIQASESARVQTSLSAVSPVSNRHRVGPAQRHPNSQNESAEVWPGTRMEIDWPNLVSSRDLILTTPPPDAVNGLLLGNGDVGVSVYGPPECLILQVGKNDLWDYRNPPNKITNRITLSQVCHWFTGSNALTSPFWGGDRIPLSQAIENAFNQPYHGPKPAGQIRFRNPALRAAPYRQRLGLWNAEVSTELGSPTTVTAQILVSYSSNVIAVRYQPARQMSFDIELARHKDTTGTITNAPEFGTAGRDLWFEYHLPASEPYPNGFDYVMFGRVLGGEVRIELGNSHAVAHVTSDGPVTLLVSVETTRDHPDPLKSAKADLEWTQSIGFDGLVRKPERLRAEPR